MRDEQASEMHLLDLPDEVLGCILGFTLDLLEGHLRSRQRYRLLLLSLVCKAFAREAEKLDRDKLLITIGERDNEVPEWTDAHRSQVKTLHFDVGLAVRPPLYCSKQD